jgi:hypothetical protein
VVARLAMRSIAIIEGMQRDEVHGKHDAVNRA